MVTKQGVEAQLEAVSLLSEQKISRRILSYLVPEYLVPEYLLPEYLVPEKWKFWCNLHLFHKLGMAGRKPQILSFISISAKFIFVS